jgi:hypothetical protein
MCRSFARGALQPRAFAGTTVALKFVYGLLAASDSIQSLRSTILPHLLLALIGRLDSVSMVGVPGDVHVAYGTCRLG